MLDFLKKLIRKKTKAAAPLTVGLSSTHERIMGGLKTFFFSSSVDPSLWGDLERALIEADAGVEVTGRLVEIARKEKSPAAVKEALASEMKKILSAPAFQKSHAGVEVKPKVVLVLGVNGAGKTTTIAKLARRYMDDGRRVLLVAGDTFRAAAIDQLVEWGKRIGADVVAQEPGSDPAAVAFDGVSRAVARGYDVAIIDTAGRLHTRMNLMEELKKIVRVVEKALPGAPHEKLLVIDATVGGNGLVQVREFNEAVGVTSACVAKLDGTARGGVVFAIAGELGIPVSYIGVGEGMGDLRCFEPGAFVEAILGA